MPTRLIAHRGGAGLRMENTLAAFAHAIALGADGAELDVHLTRDGQVIVHHDDRLNPAYCRHVDGGWITRGEALPLSALTYAELQRYEIGAPRPGTPYARGHGRVVSLVPQRIPLLRDVIRLARQASRQFVLVIEIKTPMQEAASRPWLRLVDGTLAVIAAEAFAERAILCSFDWSALRYAQQCRPGIPTWYTSVPLSWFGQRAVPATDLPPDPTELNTLRALREAGNAAWFAGFDPRGFDGSRPRAVAAAGGAAWFPFHRDCTAQTCTESAQLGLAGAAWTAGACDRVELARLIHARVDNLVLDYPDVDLAALA